MLQMPTPTQLRTQITSGTCLGSTVASAPVYAALPYAAAPLVFTQLPPTLTPTAATLTSPAMPAIASAVATGTAALSDRCSLRDVLRAAGVPLPAGARRLQSTCSRRAVRATVVCGLGVAAGSAVAVGGASAGLVAGSSSSASICNRAWTPSAGGVGGVVDRVRASVATGTRGRSLAQDHGRWLQAASGVMVGNLTTPFEGGSANSTLIVQVVLVPDEEAAIYFTNTTIVQAVWGSVLAPVLTNASLFNATFPGLNAAMVNVTGAPVALSSALMVASEGGYAPVDGFNNTNVTVVAASPSSTPSAVPSAAATPPSTRSPTALPASATPTPSATTSPAVLGGNANNNNQASPASSTVGAAVGGAVGGVVLVGIVAVVYCFCCKGGGGKGAASVHAAYQPHKVVSVSPAADAFMYQHMGGHAATASAAGRPMGGGGVVGAAV